MSPLYTKIYWNWPSGSWDEEENVKVYDDEEYSDNNEKKIFSK